MATDVDWTGVDANPYRIFVPRADMPLLQASPEVRELDANVFHQELRTLEAGVDGMPWPQTHTHQGEVVQSGVTYARFVTIIAPYTLELEAGIYSVAVTNGNVNFVDVKVPNTTSLLIQNSAGLVNLNTVLRKFEDFIYFDEFAGNTGTTPTDGTRDNPVSSEASALTLVASEGKVGVIIQDGTFTLDQAVNLLSFEGLGDPRTSVFAPNGWTITDCTFRRLTLSGDANNSSLTGIGCLLSGLTDTSGTFEECFVLTTTLAVDASEVIFNNCRSVVPGGSDQAEVDLQGRAGPVQFRAWAGGCRLENATNALCSISMDIKPGHFKLAASCTDALDVVVRGDGKYTNESSILASKIDDIGFTNVPAIWGEDLSAYAVIDSAGWLLQRIFGVVKALLGIRR
jgi:hypothetical protein